MGTEKRERQKANRAARLEAAHAAEKRQRQVQTARNLAILTVVVLVALVLYSLTGCSSSAGDGATKVDADGSTTAAGSDSGGSDGAACTTSDNGKTAVLDFTAAPKMRIDPAKTYTATVETTEGTVTLELDTERTPGTTNNFVALAENCYFDGTDLFRTEARSGIIQGGSPHTQDNTDAGPGYTIEDEGVPFSADDYAPGTIAMANTGSPNSASAQFFFLANEGGRYLADQAQLGPSAGSYVVFGTTTDGLDVLQAIAALDDGQGAPSKQVTIEKVTIEES